MSCWDESDMFLHVRNPIPKDGTLSEIVPSPGRILFEEEVVVICPGLAAAALLPHQYLSVA